MSRLLHRPEASCAGGILQGTPHPAGPHATLEEWWELLPVRDCQVATCGGGPVLAHQGTWLPRGSLVLATHFGKRPWAGV